MIVAKGAWGWGMRRVMMDYNHWAALGVLGEILPWEDNCVGLADETDQFGLRVAKITFKLHDNDKKIARAGVQKTTEVMYAAGAQEVVEEARYAHLVGGPAWEVTLAHRLPIVLGGRTTSRTSSSVTGACCRRRDRPIPG